MTVPPLRPGMVPAFHELDDDLFENLCREVTQEEDDVATVERYGTSGQRQLGIDLLIEYKDDSLAAGQCKSHQHCDEAPRLIAMIAQAENRLDDAICAVFGRFERNRRLEFPRKLVMSRVSENRVKFNSRRLHHSTHLALRFSRTARFAHGEPFCWENVLSERMGPAEGRSIANRRATLKTALLSRRLQNASRREHPCRATILECVFSASSAAAIKVCATRPTWYHYDTIKNRGRRYA